jgi:hypothetical protein
MKQLLLLAVIFTCTCLPIYAQKVALYSFGKYETAEYEQFSFWVKNNKRAEIYYAYGKDNKELKLKFLEKGILNGEDCFKVQFPNKHILYIIPTNKRLKVSDLTGKYLKDFDWKYEGPINGIGTFCQPCAEDETAAMKLIKLYFMK